LLHNEKREGAVNANRPATIAHRSDDLDNLSKRAGEHNTPDRALRRPARERLVMARDLSGQQVIVVGASSGVGRATALLAAAQGARVHLIARSVGALESAAAASEIGDGASFAVADMTDRDTMRRAVAGLERVDHLVISSAVADELKRKVEIQAVTPDQIERSFDRLRGYATSVHVVSRLLPPRASIMLWCGASAVRPPQSGFALLAAENASVTGFGRALALELAPIRVNVLMSGVVDTPIHAHDREELKAWAERELPVRRLGEPQGLADAALFLMTNPYVTAQTFLIDGGLTAV